MNKKKKQVLIWTIGIIIIIAILIVLYLNNTKSPPPINNYDNFAKCLSSKHVKMYGAFWCTHCQAQKTEFGESWQYINFTECSNPDKTETVECINLGIQYYPTWQFKDGTTLTGEVSFQQLSQKSGCRLP